MKRTAIKRRSKKTAALYRNERVPLVKRLLEERPWCERCLWLIANHGAIETYKRSTEIHELIPRGRGGSITDEANAVALCTTCHSHIHNNPKESTEEGWLKRRCNHSG